jgi:hypothetical protein
MRGMMMNKKCKELQVNATKWYIDVYLKDNPNCKKSMNDVITEKFAHLIVSECSMIYEAIDNGNDWAGTSDYQKAIYKVFHGKK